MKKNESAKWFEVYQYGEREPIMACAVNGHIVGGAFYDDTAEEIKLLKLELLSCDRLLTGLDACVEVKTRGQKVKLKRELMREDSMCAFVDYWIGPKQSIKRDKKLKYRNRHELKIAPEFYKDVKYGHKNFEIRKNDRDYKAGDILVLREFDGEQYTDKEPLMRIVEYVLKDCEQYGLKEGYCILGFYNGQRCF